MCECVHPLLPQPCFGRVNTWTGKWSQSVSAQQSPPLALRRAEPSRTELVSLGRGPARVHVPAEQGMQGLLPALPGLLPAREDARHEKGKEIHI